MNLPLIAYRHSTTRDYCNTMETYQLAMFARPAAPGRVELRLPWTIALPEDAGLGHSAPARRGPWLQRVAQKNAALLVQIISALQSDPNCWSLTGDVETEAGDTAFSILIWAYGLVRVDFAQPAACLDVPELSAALQRASSFRGEFFTLFPGLREGSSGGATGHKVNVNCDCSLWTAATGWVANRRGAYASMQVASSALQCGLYDDDEGPQKLESTDVAELLFVRTFHLREHAAIHLLLCLHELYQDPEIQKSIPTAKGLERWKSRKYAGGSGGTMTDILAIFRAILAFGSSLRHDLDSVAKEQGACERWLNVFFGMRTWVMSRCSSLTVLRCTNVREAVLRRVYSAIRVFEFCVMTEGRAMDILLNSNNIVASLVVDDQEAAVGLKRTLTKLSIAVSTGKTQIFKCTAADLARIDAFLGPTIAPVACYSLAHSIVSRVLREVGLVSGSDSATNPLHDLLTSVRRVSYWHAAHTTLQPELCKQWAALSEDDFHYDVSLEQVAETLREESDEVRDFPFSRQQVLDLAKREEALIKQNA